MTIREFHFTLGPVQGFVAQARRTRDFWSGSFILSWLSAIAMQAVKAQRGNIRFPQPDPAFMAALLGDASTRPTQGTIPNRFKAEVPDDFDPMIIQESVAAAWRALATHVFVQDLAFAENRPARAIWERQIEGFWDLQWALVAADGASNTLDRMKNWRTHAPPDEPGIKCMMMDGWQELSGAERPGRRPADAHGPERFWQTVREQGQRGMASDLRDGEMLCAIAFVKRRFARHFATFRAPMPGGWTVAGWRVPTGVPSLHYIAAAPWLAQLLGIAGQADEQGQTVRARLTDFHDAAYGLTGDYGEWDSNIHCVRKADGQRTWKALDGTVFFDAMLENAKLWGKAPGPDKARAVLRTLNALRKATGLDPVSPFYAILLMDGDELGMHMSEPANQPKITAALAAFTGRVKSCVQPHNGFLIYAGGDDVLALLPLENALGCAAALRRLYLDCFKDSGIPTSLSGAIEYAHVKMPLGKVLHDAHTLLDDIAKDGRGRDAIACRVWKPGGLTLTWAMPWDCALDGDGNVVIEQLAGDFQAHMAAGDRDLASKFFYRIRERFALLNPPVNGGGEVLDEATALDLLAMEYLNSGLVRDRHLAMDQARERLRPLLDQCRAVVRNKAEPDRSKWQRSPRLDADAALLVRFLAQKGVER